MHLGGLLVRGGVLPAVAVVGTLIGGTIVGHGVVAVFFVCLGHSWAAIALTAARIVTDRSPAVIRGEALGVYGALVALGGGFGGLLGGWLAAFGFTITFGFAGGLVVAGAGIVVILDRRFHRKPSSVLG